MKNTTLDELIHDLEIEIKILELLKSKKLLYKTPPRIEVQVARINSIKTEINLLNREQMQMKFT